MPPSPFRWASTGPLRRSPTIWIAGIMLVCVLGIGSRRYAQVLPHVVATYAGDTLWALAAFLAFGLVMPRATTGRVAASALFLSVLIEVSQLYHARWIDAVRQTRLGGLVLGFDFVWSDLACYAVGIGLGVLIERSVAWLSPRQDGSPSDGIHDHHA
jgi:hypothetical protein